jgi:hypothetical protein
MRLLSDHRCGWPARSVVFIPAQSQSVYSFQSVVNDGRSADLHDIAVAPIVLGAPRVQHQKWSGTRGLLPWHGGDRKAANRTQYGHGTSPHMVQHRKRGRMLPSPDDPDSYAIEAQQTWLTVGGFRIDIDRSKYRQNERVRLRNCQNVELTGKVSPFGTSRERYQKNFRKPRCRIRTPACACGRFQSLTRCLCCRIASRRPILIA